MSVFDRVEKWIEDVEESIFGERESREDAIFGDPKTKAKKTHRVVSSDDKYLVVEVDLPGIKTIEVRTSVSNVLVEWTRGATTKGKLKLKLGCVLDPPQARARYVDGVLTLVLRKAGEELQWTKIPVSRDSSPVAP